MERSFKSHRLQTAKTPEPATEEARPVPGQRPETKDGVAAKPAPQAKPKEIGGPSGPEPTRYGDWERNGICYDF